MARMKKEQKQKLKDNLLKLSSPNDREIKSLTKKISVLEPKIKEIESLKNTYLDLASSECNIETRKLFLLWSIEVREQYLKTTEMLKNYKRRKKNLEND